MAERGVLAVLKQVMALRGALIFCLCLILLLPLALSEHTEARCGYVVLVMAVMWLTEAIPIPATALMPIFLFPMCGVQPAKDVSSAYVNDTSMLFLGGLILAVAVEEWNLHKRIAVGVLRIVGSDPKFVMLGVILPTWFLSMWISNTATASMMIPIANAVASQMGSVQKGKKDGDEVTMTPISNTAKVGPGETYTFRGDSGQENQNNVQVESTVDQDLEERLRTADQPRNSNSELDIGPPPPPCKGKLDDAAGMAPEARNDDDDADTSPEYLRLCKGLSLCVAYGCNIGGIATLTGTPPNLVFKGQADNVFNARYKNLSLPMEGSGVTFASWMGMALPMSALIIVLAWVLLMVYFLRGGMFKKIPEEQKQGVRAIVMEESKQLGRMSMAEIEVTALFVFLAVMWISRDPKQSPGWSSLFLKGYVSDSSAAMIIVILLFLLPAEIPRVFCLRKEEHAALPYFRPLLTWEQVQRKVPWGVILLLGGGFALAKACSVSGLSKMLGDELSSLSSLQPWVLNLILCLVVACATEFTSNTATSTLLMPIMAELAMTVKVNPLYLMASAAMTTSFAFMLPVATPPNAIVFAYGHLHVCDMATVGFWMNIIAVLCLTLAVNTWGDAIFGFTTLPAIFDDAKYNLTTTT